MSIKSELRKQVKLERKSIENKSLISEEVCKKLLSNSLYDSTDVILCYSSLLDEIDTGIVIEKAIKDNKIIALPYCKDQYGNMDFYIIKSNDDLIDGSFNVKEPDINQCKLLENFDNSIVIVPALCYDKSGYRLGYGKGYYDRFLSKHNIISVGFCYESLIKDEIPHDKYDLPVDYIITESQFICCDNGGKNG